MCQENKIGVVKFKKRTRKRFCKNVRWVFGTGNMRKKESFRIYVRTNKMIMNVNMLCTIVRNTVVCKSNGTFIVGSDADGRGDVNGELVEVAVEPYAFLKGSGHCDIFSLCSR